jgi:predicted acylesterase/phospholipase RssA/CRP-like cAMP-binding protein
VAVERRIAQHFWRELDGGNRVIRFARHGHEALATLGSKPDFDILLLDIETPIVDGLALFYLIKDLKRPVKTIIVSAHSDEQELRATLNLAVFEAIPDPVEFDGFVTVMREALAEQSIAQQPTKPAESRSGLLSILRSSVLFSSLDEDVIASMGALLKTVMLNGGDILFRQGDPGDSLYIVISGRLEVVGDADGQSPRLLVTLGPGESVGEMALIDGENRSATVSATRDTQLAKLSQNDFGRLVAEHPKPILSAFLKQMSRRVRKQAAGGWNRQSSNNCIAVVPFAREIDVEAFTRRLWEQLGRYEQTACFDEKNLDNVYGVKGAARFGPEQIGHLLLANWLADQEHKHRNIVYQANFGTTPWTGRCLRQADVVLMVVGRDSDVGIARALMKDLSHLTDLSKKSVILVLLHGPQHREPRRTGEWTASIGAERLFHVRIHRADDYARLARFLCNRSVGLVLGGGFARGLGHIGVIRAMRQLDIPIDMVGGTSMGAIIAAQCAIEWDWPQMLDVSMRRSAASLKGDFTLPLVSLMTGRKFSRTIQEIADGRDIEDAWLPSFCISANLTNGQIKVHTSGDAAKSVIASARVPVIFPPLSWGEDLLVDGGLVNMVPTKNMQEFSNNGVVISVDCSAQGKFRAPDFGASHSGWKELWRRLTSRTAGRPTIGVMGILMQALEFGRAPHANSDDYADLHLVLPLDKYSYRDFMAGPQMVQTSYEFALHRFQSWMAEKGRPWAPGAPGANGDIPPPETS